MELQDSGHSSEALTSEFLDLTTMSNELVLTFSVLSTVVCTTACMSSTCGWGSVPGEGGSCQLGT